MLQVGLVKMNKLEIKITTNFHSGGMNTDKLVINITKKTYKDNCVGIGRSSGCALLPQLSNTYLIMLNNPSIQRSWKGRQ